MSPVRARTSPVHQEGAGLARFQEALRSVPVGGEGEVWIRLPVMLGDVVMTLPIVFAVKEAWERCAARRGVRLRFVLMGKRPVSLLAEAVPDLFAACHVDGEFAPAASPLALSCYWGRQRPLAVINFSKSDRLKLAAWLAGVPVRSGIADGGNNWSYHFSHPFEKNNLGHRLFRHMPMLRWLAGPDAVPRFELLDPARFGGDSVLADLRAAGWEGGPYVVFGPCPNLGNPERRWYPLDQPWLRLAALALRDGITPVLAGGAEHTEALARIAGPSGCISLAGRTRLPQLLALLAHARGTIAVDTGIAHLAAATGTPTVVVFGTGLEYWDLPCGPKVVALRGDPAGAPAYPVTAGGMEEAAHPWSAASSTIPAERAWSILGCLAGES